MIRAYCCCFTRSALELCGFFFGRNKQFLYVQVPGVDTVMDYYYWMVQHLTDQDTHLQVNTFMHAACVFFFGPILTRVFLRMTLSSSLPFVTHIRGHMARISLPSPLP